jgi:hypothetical protein
MSLKDILFFMIIGLTVALGVNHYLGLDIEFLNNIQDTIVTSGERGGSSVRSIGGSGSTGSNTRSAECERLLKSLGDAKTLARNDLDAAKKEGDTMRIREMEDNLASLARREREACR